MIRIQQVKCRPGHTQEQLLQKAAKVLRVREAQITELHIVKQSIDARKKPEIWFSYVVDVRLEQTLSESKIIQKCKSKDVTIAAAVQYRFPQSGEIPLEHPPVIVGMGPAGLFCGYLLAKAGYRPILLERGEDVDRRTETVERFWAGGELSPESNVQFGEGGAGTFSDGKLNTLVKDRDGRNTEVLRILVENGAPERILYEGKPHIGTDVLSQVVKCMRERILEWGGQVYFRTKVTELLTAMVSDERSAAASDPMSQAYGEALERKRKVIGVRCSDGREIRSDAVVLAIGHSARDTFETLLGQGVPMEAKSFAVGLRVEHPQTLINFSQYASEYPEELPPAAYKVTASTSQDRGVYSFCMCPGGYVVNASSEPGRLAVNGMSYSERDGRNANSAVIVAVNPEDYGAEGPLAGIAFQRNLEEKAYRAGSGKIPVQRYADFCREELAEETGSSMKRNRHVPDDFQPQTKGEWCFADLRELFPESVRTAFIEGMESFDRMIPGFADDAVCLLGVESRTSSPVRIHRDETFQSAFRGLYPCGEGAGYAGGITSAAMDGMKIAEAIAKIYKGM